MIRRPRLPARVDVLVVGGGVHGAAIARDAAGRGLQTLLVERRDFGWGTSSRSSKLAHGGLRYLERLQVGLVRESLRERDVLLRVAPHLCWPLPFLIPLTGPKPRAGWKVRLGLTTYDLLAGRSRLGGHRIIDAAEAEALAPGLAGSGVERAAQYNDAGMDDARIVVELVLDAARLGARCASPVDVTRLLRDGNRVTGARVEVAGRSHDVAASVTVLACGPWTNRVAGPRADGSSRLALTKGAHVFTDKQLVRSAALMLAAPSDGRIFFVIPWKDGSLVGTTDTAWKGHPDRCRPSADDVRYLLAAVDACLPGASISKSDVVAVQAGLRPLVAAEESDSPSRISRDWTLDAGTPGLLTVEGGKYTIFRKLAEKVVDAATAQVARLSPERRVLPCTTTGRPLPGAVGFAADDAAALARIVAAGASEESARLLRRTYGARAAAVVRAAGDDRELLRPTCQDHAHVPAQAIVAVRDELAATPADALLRRLDLGWHRCGVSACRGGWAKALVAAGMPRRVVHDGLDAMDSELSTQWRP